MKRRSIVSMLPPEAIQSYGVKVNLEAPQPKTIPRAAFDRVVNKLKATGVVVTADKAVKKPPIKKKAAAKKAPAKKGKR